MYVLSIETSCDETGIALIEAPTSPPTSLKLRGPSKASRGNFEKSNFKIIFNLIQSQIDVHREFGGVVPNLAKREHQKNLPILWEQAQKILKKKKIPFKKIDLIAVTVGPGLEPALWCGINFSKEIFKQIKKENKKCQLIGTNHLEGHLFSLLLNNNKAITFPAVALIVSGGHTILLQIKGKIFEWKKIGETLDDAVGESFDKVARMLGLPYPGGPEIEKRAKLGNKKFVDFPRPMAFQKNYNFSFSGLKTSVLYFLRDLSRKELVSDTIKNNVSASFQEAAFETLARKTTKASKEFKAKSILIAGGVANNRALEKNIKERLKKEKISGVEIFSPAKGLSGDNAAMIAVAGYIGLLKKRKKPLRANSEMTI